MKKKERIKDEKKTKKEKAGKGCKNVSGDFTKL